MAIRLKINHENIKQLEKHENKIHFIPADIDCTDSEEIKIDEYFENYTEKDGQVLTNSLRGFPLKGCQYDVPENYKGIVVTESTKLVPDSLDRNLYIENVFNNFTYWNWDKDPTSNDNYQQAMQWLKLSEALHTPIDPNEPEDDDIDNDEKDVQPIIKNE